jgi:general secretion pathway protein M
VTGTLPTGWRGRMLALGLAFATLAAIYTLVVAPLLELYADRTVQIETRRTLLLKLQGLAAELPGLRARVAEIRANGDSSSKLTLQGASDAIASAALQGRVEELAGAAGITIGSTESLPAEARGPYRRLGLRMVLSGNYDGLVTLLSRLETAAPPLIVDNLQLHSFQRRPGAPPGGAALDASVEIYGFRAEPRTADARAGDIVKR